MKIAIIATFTHPTRRPESEPSFMQTTVPELIAGLLPEHVEIELYNEKERPVPLDRHWDMVFFTYLHSYYDHTKVLSMLFRARGMVTVTGGRHASHYVADCLQYFDAVVTGEPESNIPELFADFEKHRMKRVYSNPSFEAASIRPYRYDLVDLKSNPYRVSGIEATRGCPFACNFCVLTGWEKFRFRPIDHVVRDIQTQMTWNRSFGGLLSDTFVFLDNNLGGSPRHLRSLCEALVPLKKTWGCAATYNILRDRDLLALMSRAGCRYIYTGLESLNPESIASMNKGQNRLSDLKRVIDDTYRAGIVLTVGLIVGADGDTNEYLQRVPEYLADLNFFGISFVGVVAPYPETPFFRHLEQEGRLLPGAKMRDADGYTVCHRPANLSPDEVVEHYKNICEKLSSLGCLGRHFMRRIFMSQVHSYRRTVVVTTKEISTIKAPLANPQRTYIAGRDPQEIWDQQQLSHLGIPSQPLVSPPQTIAVRRVG
jgi:radical SAM superfamily enzyme YgiQ (UPF0313 family)